MRGVREKARLDDVLSDIGNVLNQADHGGWTWVHTLLRHVYGKA